MLIWPLHNSTSKPIVSIWKLFCLENVVATYIMRKIGCLTTSLQWRHNGRDSVSNQQPHDCFLNRLFRRRSKKTSKLRVTGLCAGNSSEADEVPAQMASNAENVSIWWRHHVADLHNHTFCCSLWRLSLSLERVAYCIKYWLIRKDRHYSHDINTLRNSQRIGLSKSPIVNFFTTSIHDETKSRALVDESRKY